MEKLSNEKLLQHKIIKKVNETQNLSNIEQPLQAPCLPSGPKSSGILSSDIPELLILQGSSLNVCFNFACLFEVWTQKCFFLFPLPSKMADAPFLKIPSNFYTASIFHRTKEHWNNTHSQASKSFDISDFP